MHQKKNSVDVFKKSIIRKKMENRFHSLQLYFNLFLKWKKHGSLINVYLEGTVCVIRHFKLTFL